MQFEFPWALGPADGRYVVRDPSDGTTTHVLLLATLGAPERRLLRARRRPAAPEPAPTPVTTTRATVIEAEPSAPAAAEAWLSAADETTAATALHQLQRAVRAHRLASADASVHEPGHRQALVVRAGYGAGEQVAEGRWAAARELPPPPEGRRRRSAALQPQERLASLLGGHTHALACEELTLRARHDLDQRQLREAALQLRLALDAALAELAADPAAAALEARVAELHDARTRVGTLADVVLGGPLPSDAVAVLDDALGRLEAALRARAALTANPQREG